MKLIFVSTMILLTTEWAEASIASGSHRHGISVQTNDSVNCFPAKLWGYLNEVKREFGTVVIVSGEREAKDNARRDGAKNSQHIHCNAADFNVPGVSRYKVAAFLAKRFKGRGGIGFYCGGRFHLDVGTPRTWGLCKPNPVTVARYKYKSNPQVSSNNDAQINPSYQRSFASRSPGHRSHNRNLFGWLNNIFRSSSSGQTYKTNYNSVSYAPQRPRAWENDNWGEANR